MTARGGAPPEAAFLTELLGRQGIVLPPDAVGKLVRHAAEMLRWNRSIRLTAIVRPDEVAVKHILDSLLLLHFAPFRGKLLDFGSGAGYPGIPLAIVLPDVQVVLLEASGKKCAFLAEAVRTLSLRNAEAVHGRLGERLPRPLGRFEQIVTRATLPAAEAAGLLIPFLAPAGRVFLMTGPGGGDGGGGPVLPEAAASERRVRFSLPLGMGSREIREIRVP